MIDTFFYIAGGLVTNKDAIKKAFTLSDGKYRLRISRAGKRSIMQNGYYWGCIIPAIQSGLYDLGHELDKEEIHDWLKVKFNYVEVINKGTGEYERVPISTTKLTKLEFCEYIEKIQRFAAEFLNVVIADPGQSAEIFDYSNY
jgi:hypothetical protein